MRYIVVWKQAALDELAEIWLAANNRQLISLAASRVDEILGEDPDGKGDEFYGDLLLETAPLYIVFAVSKQDRLVRIIQVWIKCSKTFRTLEQISKRLHRRFDTAT